MKKVLFWSTLQVFTFIIFLSQSFAQFSADVNTIALYHLDEGAGTVLTDASGNNFDGTLRAGSWTASGRFIYGIELDGIVDYFDFPSPDDFGLQVNGYSIEVWVKPFAYRNEPCCSNATYIFSASKEQYEFHLSQPQGVDGGRFIPATGLPGNGGMDGGGLEIGEWNYLLATVDSQGLARYYVNGVLQAELTNVPRPADSQALTFGKRASGYFGTFHLNGVIDEIRISNVARVPNQPPDCSAAAIADQSADANCQVTISGDDVTGVSDPDGDPLTITVKPTTLVLGANTVSVTADDENGGSCNTDITVNVVDDTAPTPDVANLPDVTGECSVTLTAPTATDNCAGSITATTTDPTSYTTQGTFSVTWTYDDGNGNSSQQVQNVIVDDVTAPTLTANSTSITMWPPNHKYTSFDLNDFGVSALDNCAGDLTANVTISKIESDEPEDVNGGGDGNTNNDIVIDAGCQSMQLRAERQGGGNGRVYTIHLSVDDGTGNSGTTTSQVHVPHNKKSTAVDDGPSGYEVGCGSSTSVSIDEDVSLAFSTEALPESYELMQNHPNPFNPSTTITFAIPEASEIKLSIYNLHGQLIQMLHSGVVAAGQHSMVWNGSDFHGAKVASGIYLYQLKGDGFVATRKLILTK